MLISFIVPVYNRKDILHECMESLLKSPWKDYEIILVDDASTDGSSILCDKYEMEYSFVHTIHLKENCGPGMARNYGVTIAQGEWIFFADSDDVLITENLEVVATKINSLPPEVDIIAVDTVDEFNRVRWLQPYFQSEEILSCLTFMQRHSMRLQLALWNYIFRRNYIQSHKLLFLPLYAHEDLCFFLDVFDTAKYIACIPVFYYCYRRGVSSNSLVTQNQCNYSLVPYEQHITKLCAYIRDYTNRGDLFRQGIYTQLLVDASLNVVRILAQQHSSIYCRPKVSEPEISPEGLIRKGLIPFLEDILHKCLMSNSGIRCYVALANQTTLCLVDYLFSYGYQVQGIIDNGVKNVKTPQGRKIPVYSREEIKKVCTNEPIFLTSNWLVSSKLKIYFQNNHLVSLRWGWHR